MGLVAGLPKKAKQEKNLDNSWVGDLKKLIKQSSDTRARDVIVYSLANLKIPVRTLEIIP